MAGKCRGCSVIAQAETGIRRATAVVGGCYGVSRDDGGIDQGSVVVRIGCGRDYSGRGKGTQGYGRGWERK